MRFYAILRKVHLRASKMNEVKGFQHIKFVNEINMNMFILVIINFHFKINAEIFRFIQDGAQ